MSYHLERAATKLGNRLIQAHNHYPVITLADNMLRFEGER